MQVYWSTFPAFDEGRFPHKRREKSVSLQMQELCAMACSGHDATHEQHSMHSPILTGTVLPSFSS